MADPTALGLFGLAIVTFVASSQKLGLTDGLSFVLPRAIFLGGPAQLIAAIFDFKHNNLFGATAFSAYGLSRHGHGHEHGNGHGHGNGNGHGHGHGPAH